MQRQMPSHRRSRPARPGNFNTLIGLVVDDNFCCTGLITVKDIKRIQRYPNSCKDAKSRLRVAAAVGTTPDLIERTAALVEEGVDAIFVDTAHGHTKSVVNLLKNFLQSN